MLSVVVGVLGRYDLGKLRTSYPMSPLGLLDLIGPACLIEFGCVGFARRMTLSGCVLGVVMAGWLSRFARRNVPAVD